jgi:hypothetical protein
VAALVDRHPGSGGLTAYAAPVQPAPDPVPARRTPPAPAIAAAVLGLASSGVPAIFALLAVALSAGRFAGSGWVLVIVPVILTAALLAGTVLLFLGRSWLALALPAGVLTALLLIGYAQGGGGGGTFAVLTLLIPLAATVLAVLPPVRRWVAARRSASAAG